MYNKIWEEGEILITWKHVTITPLLKEGKDLKDVRSYRLVALTNILCKIFKKKRWGMTVRGSSTS